MPGRGAGRLVDMNPALDVMRLEVAGNRMPLSLVSAEKNLVPLPEGHFLRRKVEDPKGLAAFAESEPSEALRLLLTSFGRSLTVQEVKDHFAGLVPEERWTPFWTAARKNRQVLVAGSAKSAKVTWSDSADAAEGSVREAFLKATPAARVDLARKHSKRSKELALFFAQALAGDAQKVAPGQPALAWELSQAAARLAPDQPEAFPAETLLASADLRRVTGEIRDRGPREKALGGARVPHRSVLHRADRRRGRLPVCDDAGRRGDQAVDLSEDLRSPRSAPRRPSLALRAHARRRQERRAGALLRVRPTRRAWTSSPGGARG